MVVWKWNVLKSLETITPLHRDTKTEEKAKLINKKTAKVAWFLKEPKNLGAGSKICKHRLKGEGGETQR